jgi:hypothetical protein
MRTGGGTLKKDHIEILGVNSVVGVWGNIKLDFEDGVFLDCIHPDQVMNSRIP